MNAIDAGRNAVNASKDHAAVAVYPPLIPLTSLVLACILQWLQPLGWLAQFNPAWRIPLGFALAAAGVVITATGRRTLVHRGTNVNPFRPTTALATEGIFGLTRNPLYTGILPVMIGVALIFALDWLALLIVPNYLILHFAVVRREETYLERKFGSEYRAYKARVPRYFWPF